MPATATAPPAPPSGAPVQIVTIVSDTPAAPPNALPEFEPAVMNAGFQPLPTDTAGPPNLQTQAFTVSAIQDATLAGNGGISYTIGVETPLSTGNGPDTIHLSATLPDGAPLPAWLKLDPATHTISGRPPPNTGPIVIVITATDEHGHSARTVVHLGTGATPHGAGPNPKGSHSSLLPDRHGRAAREAAAPVDLRTLRGERGHPPVRQGLTAQIRSAHRAGQLAHQAAMLRAAEQMLRRS